MGKGSNKDLFIGKLIQQKVDEKGFTYAEFARRINCSRTSLYYLFNSRNIDVERLMLVCKVLDYDFIADIYYDGADETRNEQPFLQLPFKDGKIDLSHLPKEVLVILKERIDESL